MFCTSPSLPLLPPRRVCIHFTCPVFHSSFCLFFLLAFVIKPKSCLLVCMCMPCTLENISRCCLVCVLRYVDTTLRHNFLPLFETTKNLSDSGWYLMCLCLEYVWQGMKGAQRWMWIEWLKLRSSAVSVSLSVSVSKVKSKHFHLHMRGGGQKKLTSYQLGPRIMTVCSICSSPHYCLNWSINPFF